MRWLAEQLRQPAPSVRLGVLLRWSRARALGCVGYGCVSPLTSNLLLSSYIWLRSLIGDRVVTGEG